MLVAGGLIMGVLAVLASHATGPAAVCEWIVFGITGVVTLAVLAFFRDPDRIVPQEDGIMVSPADGTVTEITVLQEYPPLVEALARKVAGTLRVPSTPSQKNATPDSASHGTRSVPATLGRIETAQGGGDKPGEIVRLGIFLSVFSVHLNRAPCAGVILETLFTPGRFWDARHPRSGIENQSNALLLGNPDTRAPVALVKQIVGAIARRIITPVRAGQTLARGQRFGMIAFGSRTELYLRADEWEFTVRVGEKLKAGRDVVARRKKGA